MKRSTNFSAFDYKLTSEKEALLKDQKYFNTGVFGEIHRKLGFGKGNIAKKNGGQTITSKYYIIHVSSHYGSLITFSFCECLVTVGAFVRFPSCLVYIVRLQFTSCSISLVTD